MRGAYDKVKARTHRNWKGKRIRTQHKSSRYRGQKDCELLSVAWLMTTQHRDRQGWGFKGEGWANGNVLWPLACPRDKLGNQHADQTLSNERTPCKSLVLLPSSSFLCTLDLLFRATIPHALDPWARAKWVCWDETSSLSAQPDSVTVAPGLSLCK